MLTSHHRPMPLAQRFPFLSRVTQSAYPLLLQFSVFIGQPTAVYFQSAQTFLSDNAYGVRFFGVMLSFSFFWRRYGHGGVLQD